MSRRARLLDMARRLLERKTTKGQRHVALAFRGSRLVSIGFNSYIRTHPTQAAFARRAGQNNRSYLHAELDALLKGPATTLIVARINRNGRLTNSKPCPICQLAIKAYGIKEVIHS